MPSLPLISEVSTSDFSGSSSIEDWKQWRWQLKNSIRDLTSLKDHMTLTQDEESKINELSLDGGLPFQITPHYLSLIKATGSVPLRKQLIPSLSESDDIDFQRRDPLGEADHESVPHLIHRYPDRALMFVTDRCAAYCRYCTRKRLVGQGPTPQRDNWTQAIDYIRAHPEIKDVILSGGDALLLSDTHLLSLLERLQKINHVEIVRLATRFLTFAPMRITKTLVLELKKFQPVYFLVHFNHLDEINKDTEAAISLLVDAGFPVLNQTVLLKGVNDNTRTLKNLFHRLSVLRVRPYYLHQCDLVEKTAGFRVPIKEAIALYGTLRGTLSGLSIPTFVVDIPGGYGKVAMAPNPIVREDETQIYLRGFDGEVAPYPLDKTL
jgi:lysine 2,3-aminomutase